MLKENYGMVNRRKVIGARCLFCSISIATPNKAKRENELTGENLA